MLTIKMKLDETDLIKVFDKNKNPFLISFGDFKAGLEPEVKTEVIPVIKPKLGQKPK